LACLPCGADEVTDCDGNCAPLDWLGDGICDEGDFGNFKCEAHSWDQGDCCPDDSGNEPNDTCGTATLVQGGIPLDFAEYANMSICASDEDWYSFTLEEGNFFIADLYFEHQLGDLDMHLYEEANCLAPLASSASSDDDESLIFEVLATGVYLLRVEGFGLEQANTYELWLMAL
jgi:hypothetical protein